MSELLIDISRVAIRCSRGRLPTGIDRVCLAYVRHFGSTARAVIRKGRWTWILPHAPSQQLFTLLLAPSPGWGRILSKLLLTNLPLPFAGQVAPGAILLNVGHNGIERPEYADWLARYQLRPLYMVHDLIPLTHPEFCRPAEDLRHDLRLRTILTTAAGVITNSRATLDALTAFADRTGLPLPPTTAALLAAWDLPAPAAARPVSYPYFLMLGTIEPRKNHWLILQLWRRLIETVGAAAPRLVLIGQRGWECENIVDMLERCALLRDHVVELPECSDAELANYLAHAQALLFPSFTEGFGIPAAEALSLGTPVIASEIPVFREIFADVPDYCDPLDGMAWLQAIRDYSDPAGARRTQQIRRLRNFSLPTWPDHFQQVEALLDQLRKPHEHPGS